MSSATIEIGSVLSGRYRIEAILGAGGMSTVYRAADESLGRTVALKVFRESLTDAKALARQRSEVQLIASFSHPALVTLFDAIAIDDASVGEHPFLVMQFVDGDDLGVELARGPLTEARTAALGANIADALDYVHEQGVVHRDVKPGNILVVREPRPSDPGALLADFGIARFLDGLALTNTGSVLGTANYLSPEQALGRSLTPATDIYSLGLVLAEAVSGRRAFPGSGMESVAARISGDPSLPTGTSDAFAALLRSMTDREPSLRSSAADVRDRLRALVVTDELPGTVALAAVPQETQELDAGYAPTLVMPAESTTPLPEIAEPAGRRLPRWALVAAAVAIAAVIAIVVAVALPGSLSRSQPRVASTPTRTSSTTTPVTTKTTPKPTTAATSVSTPVAPAAPVDLSTPSVPATPSATVVPPVTPTTPAKNKPGKGNGKGKGHKKKP